MKKLDVQGILVKINGWTLVRSKCAGALFDSVTETWLDDDGAVRGATQAPRAANLLTPHD